MDIYSGLNKTLRNELNYFPKKKRIINAKKFALRTLQGLGIFLIVAISLKVVSLPGISFSMNDKQIGASVATLEKPESAEVKAEKDNQTLSPLSAIQAKELKGENEGRINVLILGTPGKGNPAPYLTDSIIVLSLDVRTPEEPKATLISLPRDLLVRIPGGYVTKINSLYILDKKKVNDLNQLEILEKTIEDITSLKINYFVVMELEGLGKLVDAVGGVRVYVNEPIYDPSFPKAGYGYETFIMPAGWQFLSGDLAEKYVRVRHVKGNDYGRMARQQQIIEALRDKVSELNLLSDLPTFLEMEKIVSSYFETNVSKEEGVRAIEIAKNLKQKDIIYKVIDPSTGLITSGSVNFGGTNAFVLWPKAGQFNYSEIQQYIKSLIEPTEKSE